MNIIKSAIAGAASAVGTHFADEAINLRPYDKKVYYGAAAIGALGAFLMRNKSPVVAGVLLGVGAGSAYQGYVRNPPPSSGMTAAVPMAAQTSNQFAYFTTPTDVYPVPSAPKPTPVATGPSIGGMTVDEWTNYGEKGLDWGKKAFDSFGLGGDAPVPYTQAQYDSDTMEFDNE